MKIAGIDIGSNTILMQIIDLYREDNDFFLITVLREEQGIARLAENFSKKKIINESSINKAEETLKKFRKIWKELNVEKVIAVGTSAIREANNRYNVVKRLENAINNDAKIEILTAEKEATLSYKASIKNIAGNYEKYIVIDIGGGSTEIIVGNRKEIEHIYCLKFGSVKLTEKYQLKQPISERLVKKIGTILQSELGTLGLSKIVLPQKTVVIAIAGTPTTLATVAMNTKEFDMNKIHNFVFHPDEFHRTVDKILCSKLESLIDDYAINPARADVLSAGAMMLDAIWQFLHQRFPQIKNFVVSTSGLRNGIILNYIESLE